MHVDELLFRGSFKFFYTDSLNSLDWTWNEGIVLVTFWPVPDLDIFLKSMTLDKIPN